MVYIHATQNGSFIAAIKLTSVLQLHLANVNLELYQTQLYKVQGAPKHKPLWPVGISLTLISLAKFKFGQ